MMKLILCLALLGLPACSDEPATDEPSNTSAQADTVISDSTVLLVLASDSAIEAARASMSADDFSVMADDLSYYRGMALEQLDQLGRPYVALDGRRPLSFRVNGRTERIDFADVQMLDFIVLYTPDAQPRILATNEIDQVTAWKR